MHNSKMMIAVKLLCFFLMFSVVTSLLNIAVIDSSKSFNQKAMDEFYEQKEIDLVYLGSSSVYRSCNPLIFDEVLGMNTFNLGTSSQGVMDSYFLLKETFRLYNPRCVVMNLSYWRLTNEEQKDQISSHLVFDYLKWSLNKAEYLSRAFSINNYQTALFPCYRGRDQLAIRRLVSNITQNTAYANSPLPERTLAELDSITDDYFTKGFVRSSYAFEVGRITKPEPLFFSNEQVAPHVITYLDKIIKLCKENDAELILHIVTQHPGSVQNVVNYDDFDLYIQNIADTNGLTYWNFSFIKPQYLQIEDDMFYDYQHMNNNLSSKYSELFAEILSDYLIQGNKNQSRYFYNSYDEFMQGRNRVAVTWIDKLTENKVLAESYAGNLDVEYQFSYAKNEEESEFVIFRQYNGSAEAFLPKLESGEYIIRVEARALGSTESYEQMGEYVLKILEDE